MASSIHLARYVCVYAHVMRCYVRFYPTRDSKWYSKKAHAYIIKVIQTNQFASETIIILRLLDKDLTSKLVLACLVVCTFRLENYEK